MIKKLFFTLLCTAVCRTISAQVVDPYVPAPENLRARTEFQDAKFGIFLHWGLYSLLGTGEWTMTNRHQILGRGVRLLHDAPPRRLFDVGHRADGLRHRGRHAV